MSDDTEFCDECGCPLCYDEFDGNTCGCEACARPEDDGDERD